MPYKNHEQKRVYHREYMRRRRAKARQDLLNPPTPGETQETVMAPRPELIPRSLNWTKPYERRGDYYLQGGWLFDSYSGRPVKRFA